MKLDNERLSDPDWDERPEIDPDDDSADHSRYGEDDPDLDEVNDWWHDIDPWGEEDPQWDPPLYDHAGVTAEGFTLLAAMDSQGDFI